MAGERRKFVVLLAGMALAAACAVSAPAADQPTSARDGQLAPSWQQLRGDLPLDPEVTLGQLPNGMRYVIQTTKSAPGRAAMQLVISAGSMHEPNGHDGVAHFLEHMAFHGSKNVPDGEMQKSMERLGLRPGADTNASTGADRTIYRFNLARNDAESIDTGLMLFREIAGELNLDPTVIEKERGVVLAELRERETPMLSMQRAQQARDFGNHPYARSPGGRAEVVQTISAEQLRSFYDAFYRPERAIVVVAGDVHLTEIETKIAATFSLWTGRGMAGKNPPPLNDRPSRDSVAIDVIEGMPLTMLQVQWFDTYREQPLTRASRREQLVEQLAAAILSERSGQILADAGKPAQNFSGVMKVRTPGVWNGRRMTAGGVNDAAKTVELMILAARQAAEHGVTQQELDRMIELQRTQRGRGVESGQTAPPELLATMIAMTAATNGAFVSAKDSFAMFEEQAANITLAEINAVLRKMIEGEPTVTFRTSASPSGGVEALRASFVSAMVKPVEMFNAAPMKPWPYTDFGPPGKIAERREIADVDATLVRFENGVRLTIKKNSFRKNDVVARVMFGLGRLQMPRDKMDASDFGVAMWGAGGLGKLTEIERRTILRGDFLIPPSARSYDDAFAFETCGGGCLTPDRLDRFMQLAAAMFVDPAYRTDEWANLIRSADNGDKTMMSTARSAGASQLSPLTHSGDVRWSYNTADMRKAWTPEDAVAWIRPIVAGAPLEVIVVGDIEVDAVIASVASTLGALPARKEAPEPLGLRDVKFPAPDTVTVEHAGPANQGMAYIYWPTTDLYADLLEHRRRLVLVLLMEARAQERLRGIDGKSYAPSALAVSDLVLPGYGFITMSTDYPPAELDRAIATFETIAAELATQEVSADEFERIMKPQAEGARTQRDRNAYWGSNLAGAHTSSRLLDYVRTADAHYSNMTPADVMETARRWLRPETAWKMKVVPAASGQ